MKQHTKSLIGGVMIEKTQFGYYIYYVSYVLCWEKYEKQHFYQTMKVLQMASQIFYNLVHRIIRPTVKKISLIGLTLL